MASIHIHAPYMIAAGAIWPPVCAGIVALRFMTRRAQRTPLGIDDWLLIPALVLITGLGAAIIAGSALGGIGYATPNPPTDDVFHYESNSQLVTRATYFASVIIQIWALFCIKVSAMLFYRRIFRLGTRSGVSMAIWVVIALVIIWAVGFTIPSIFLCGKNVSYLWGTLADQMRCADTVSEQLALTISDMLLDLIVFSFPIPLVWRLQMRNKQKFAMIAIFCLGAMAIISSIIRMAIMLELLQVEYQMTSDGNFLSTSACFLEIFEVGFGLCAICLPTLSGALRLQAMQPIVKGFNSLVSNISRVSLRSGSSRNKEEALHRKDSESDSSQHRAATQETAKTKRHDIEMGREDVPLDTFVR